MKQIYFLFITLLFCINSSLTLGQDKSDLVCTEKDRKYAEFWNNYYDPEEAFNFGETIKKIITPTSLILNHSSTREKATLEKGNLEKNGFTVFQKDNSNSLKYNRTAGNQGPEEINLN